MHLLRRQHKSADESLKIETKHATKVACPDSTLKHERKNAMKMKHAEQRQMTTQYIVNDGKNEFHVTEILGGEEWDFVFLYDEDAFCIAEFKILSGRASEWFGDIWYAEESITEAKVKEIANFIVQQHKNDNEILKESLK